MQTLHDPGSCRSIVVDIGEADNFYVELEPGTTYQRLYKSDCSVVYLAMSQHVEERVVRVCWSKYKRVAQSKGYLASQTCRDLGIAPVIHSREMHIVGHTYVQVMVRSYISGVPLSSVWHMLSQEDKDNAMSQVSRLCDTISQYVSDEFMCTNGRNLSTSCPVMFLNYRILLSMISLELRKGDISVLSMNTFVCMPVLHHSNLSMDHVIYDRGAITGLVGWSKADYVPEIFDRMRYRFKPGPLGDGKVWTDAMSNRPLLYDLPPPLYALHCMYYCYYMYKNSVPDFCWERVSVLLKDASTEMLTQCYGKMDSDQWSQASHKECTEAHRDSYHEDVHDNKDNVEAHSVNHHKATSSTDTLTLNEATLRELESDAENTDNTSGWSTWTDDDGNTIQDLFDQLSASPYDHVS